VSDSPRPRYEDVQAVLRHQLSRRSPLGASALTLTGLLAACSGGGTSYSDRPQDTSKATLSVNLG